MKIIICMKQVPDHGAPQESFIINTLENKVEFRGIQPVLSLFDENALEAALLIKDTNKEQVKVSILTVGKRISKPVMSKALAAGADELIIVDNESFEAAQMDSFATATALAAAVKKIENYDLILVGRQAADWNAGQVGIGLAVKLGIPVITLAKRVSVSGKKVIVERLIPNGHEVVEADLPAIVMVSNEVGELRYPTMIQRRDAKNKPVISWGIGEIGYEPGESHKVKIRTLIKPELKHRKCQYATGETPADLGKNLALALLQDKVIG
ncbi:MAG: electron transfer flavoprotein subunit beta/FixA family protein [Desulfomonilia bacterium]